MKTTKRPGQQLTGAAISGRIKRLSPILRYTRTTGDYISGEVPTARISICGGKLAVLRPHQVGIFRFNPAGLHPLANSASIGSQIVADMQGSPIGTYVFRRGKYAVSLNGLERHRLRAVPSFQSNRRGQTVLAGHCR